MVMLKSTDSIKPVRLMCQLEIVRNAANRMVTVGEARRLHSAERSDYFPTRIRQSVRHSHVLLHCCGTLQLSRTQSHSLASVVESLLTLSHVCAAGLAPRALPDLPYRPPCEAQI